MAAMRTAAGRRHVHLCLTDHRDQNYTLHSVDVAPLFDAEPDADPEAMGAALPLPPPAARFQAPPDPRGRRDVPTDIHFHALGGTRIVSIDELRRTLIYDAASGAVRAGPMVGAEKYHTLSASVPGADGVHDLYLLNHIPRRSTSCFEGLLYEPDRDDWYWHALPEPPFVHEPGYDGAHVRSHAAAGAAVWTYAEGVGTYSFHTARRAWCKEGDWALPFRGKAECVPVPGPGGDRNLWFGISSSADRRLCAVDPATATASSPPEVCGVWEDLRPPEEWSWKDAAVVHLGCGRLCTVRFFATEPTGDKVWRKRRGPVAVITAVEVQAQHDDDGDDGGGRRIQVVRRGSTCIKLADYNASVYWIL